MSSHWDMDQSAGELVTMKKIQPVLDEDPLEKTIRPNWNFPAKSERNDDLPRPSTSRASPRKQSASRHNRHHSRAKSNISNKFELPSRPDVVYREHSVEDYSDLFDDNDGFFNQRLGLKKVCSTYVLSLYLSRTNSLSCSPMPLSCFTLQTSPACHARRSHLKPVAYDENPHRGLRYFLGARSKDLSRQSRSKNLLKTTRRIFQIYSVLVIILRKTTKATKGLKMEILWSCHAFRIVLGSATTKMKTTPLLRWIRVGTRWTWMQILHGIAMPD